MANKTKTIFVCSGCGYESTKWLGKCPSCNEWNTFYEEKIAKSNDKLGATSIAKKSSKPLQLNEVIGKEDTRVSSGFNELDRVLGGRFSKWFFSSIRW